MPRSAQTPEQTDEQTKPESKAPEVTPAADLGSLGDNGQFLPSTYEIRPGFAREDR